MRSLPALPMTELARFRGGPTGKVVLVAITIIPLLYAGLLVWANIDPTHRLSSVTAAVVNEDQPVTITGSDGEDQVVPLGRTLAGELTSSEESSNFDWVLTDAQDARSGLADGTYAAVVTIPSDFSADATSTSGDDGTAAQQAVLSVQTNDGANFLTGTITRLIATTAADALSASVEQTYLQNIYVGFTTLHQQLADASDSAARLADGTTQVADGAGSLASGASDLTAGLGTLTDGADDLADGSAALATGAGSLAAGSADLASGASDLAAGLSTLGSGVSALPAQTQALADGAAATDAGAQQLAARLAPFASATADLPARATALDQSTQQISTQVSGTLAPGATALSTGAGDLASGVTDYTDAVAAMNSGVCASLTATPATDARLAGLCAALAGLEATSSDLVDGATQVSTGASTLSAGISGTSDPSNPSLVTALTALQQQGTAPFAAQAPTIAQAASAAAAGAADLATGTSQVSAGAATLAAAAPALASGIDQAASGADAVASGAGTAATGAGSLATGATRAASGAASVASGAGSAAVGAQSLTDGADELTSGADQVDSGARALADGLADGADAVPTYSDAETQNLSTVAATPVTTAISRLNEVESYGYGLAPYFMSLAAWVGAMALYMILRALPQRAIASTAPSWRVALAGYAPGAVLSVLQAVLMVLVLRYAVGVEPRHLLGLFGFAVLVGLTFTALNQALIAMFGTAGRFVGLILICLQLTSAGATYPVQTAPAFFQALHPFLPMTYTVEGIRSLIAGGGLGIAQACVTLLVWLVVALGLSVVAAGRREKWTVDRLHPELAL